MKIFFKYIFLVCWVSRSDPDCRFLHIYIYFAWSFFFSFYFVMMDYGSTLWTPLSWGHKVFILRVYIFIFLNTVRTWFWNALQWIKSGTRENVFSFTHLSWMYKVLIHLLMKLCYLLYIWQKEKKTIRLMLRIFFSSFRRVAAHIDAKDSVIVLALVL